ncbi:hypothetical protein BJ742DRAFT_769171 [Cladochytrium replicatum]|nr:hypothetical protein BJ742DRAFT_769171 [Cladochytrium replicatum]
MDEDHSPSTHEGASNSSVLRGLLKPLKTVVSKKKRRFVDQGFNLDLTYITDNLIAMGFPADNIEGLYRNSFSEVKRFLDQRHKDSYQVYNLCSERSYDPERFEGRVQNYPFEDHSAPPIELFHAFCNDVAEWLASSPTGRNVAVIHCKAGKGRTGVMVCSFLMYSGITPTAEEALRYYNTVRTSNAKGITIPSQIRYVHYAEQLIQNKFAYVPRELCIQTIRLHTVPIPIRTSTNGAQLLLKLKMRDPDGMLSSSLEADCIRDANGITLTMTKPVVVVGDVKVELFVKSIRKDKICHFWFNTSFPGTHHSQASPGSPISPKSPVPTPSSPPISSAATPSVAAEVKVNGHKKSDSVHSKESDRSSISDSVDRQFSTAELVTDVPGPQAPASPKSPDTMVSTASSSSQIFSFYKQEIDIANKDKSHRVFDKDFHIDIVCTEAVSRSTSPVRSHFAKNMSLSPNRGPRRSDSRRGRGGPPGSGQPSSPKSGGGRNSGNTDSLRDAETLRGDDEELPSPTTERNGARRSLVTEQNGRSGASTPISDRAETPLPFSPDMLPARSRSPSFKFWAKVFSAKPRSGSDEKSIQRRPSMPGIERRSTTVTERRAMTPTGERRPQTPTDRPSPSTPTKLSAVEIFRKQSKGRLLDEPVGNQRLQPTGMGIEAFYHMRRRTASTPNLNPSRQPESPTPEVSYHVPNASEPTHNEPASPSRTGFFLPKRERSYTNATQTSAAPRSRSRLGHEDDEDSMYEDLSDTDDEDYEDDDNYSRIAQSRIEDGANHYEKHAHFDEGASETVTDQTRRPSMQFGGWIRRTSQIMNLEKLKRRSGSGPTIDTQNAGTPSPHTSDKKFNWLSLATGAQASNNNSSSTLDLREELGMRRRVYSAKDKTSTSAEFYGDSELAEGKWRRYENFLLDAGNGTGAYKQGEADMNSLATLAIAPSALLGDRRRFLTTGGYEPSSPQTPQSPVPPTWSRYANSSEFSRYAKAVAAAAAINEGAGITRAVKKQFEKGIDVDTAAMMHARQLQAEHPAQQQ